MLKGAAKNYDEVYLLERQNFVKQKINANVEKKFKFDQRMCTYRPTFEQRLILCY